MNISHNDNIYLQKLIKFCFRSGVGSAGPRRVCDNDDNGDNDDDNDDDDHSRHREVVNVAKLRSRVKHIFFSNSHVLGRMLLSGESVTEGLHRERLRRGRVWHANGHFC